METAQKLVVQEVFQVLYSPVKAFRKIIEKPDFKGVLLVLVLIIASMVVSQYVLASKLSIENRTPENDDWTESLTNLHNWTSNGELAIDEIDYEMGNADGNHSITSSVADETGIWMKITDIGPVNSSETDDTELFFWIKWTRENGSPSSGTLKLLSGNEDSYFETEITSFLGSNGEWVNATLNIGPDQGWTTNNSPDWQSITGIKFSLDWSDSANTTMKIDGLFFRKFSSPLVTGGFEAVILTVIIQVLINSAINWVLWAGILIIVGKLFQEDLGRWNVFFVIFGHAFIATVFYTLLNVIPLSTLPMLQVPLDADAFNAMLNAVWVPFWLTKCGCMSH